MSEAKEVGRQIAELVAALPPLRKDTEGQARGGTYKYITLDQIMAKLRPGLTERGWSIGHDMKWTDASDSMPPTPVLLTALFGTDGAPLRSCACPMLGGGDMQKLGSAITYARRYSIAMLFGLVADEDDDGAKASEPETPQASVIDQLTMLRRVSELTDDQQVELKREVMAFGKRHGATGKLIGELITELFERSTLAEMTSGEVAQLMNEIESRAS